jgi:hypothetical protein
MVFVRLPTVHILAVLRTIVYSLREIINNTLKLIIMKMSSFSDRHPGAAEPTDHPELGDGDVPRQARQQLSGLLQRRLRQQGQGR